MAWDHISMPSLNERMCLLFVVGSRAYDVSCVEDCIVLLALLECVWRTKRGVWVVVCGCGYVHDTRHARHDVHGFEGVDA